VGRETFGEYALNGTAAREAERCCSSYHPDISLAQPLHRRGFIGKRKADLYHVSRMTVVQSFWKTDRWFEGISSTAQQPVMFPVETLLQEVCFFSAGRYVTA
jgi:hypothetical protein